MRIKEMVKYSNTFANLRVMYFLRTLSIKGIVQKKTVCTIYPKREYTAVSKEKMPCTALYLWRGRQQHDNEQQGRGQ